MENLWCCTTLSEELLHFSVSGSFSSSHIQATGSKSASAAYKAAHSAAASASAPSDVTTVSVDDATTAATMDLTTVAAAVQNEYDVRSDFFHLMKSNAKNSKPLPRG